MRNIEIPQERASAVSIAMSDVATWRILLLVALCVGSVAVRVPFLSVPLTDDEGAYAYWASIWTQDHQLYRDFIFARPQGLLVLFKGILATLGGSVEAIRLAGALFNCIATVALFYFARSFFSEREAWVSASLYAIFSTAPRIEGFTSNAEIFTLAPLIINAFLTWKERWFLAGIATAIAFQLKPSGVEGCVLIAIWIFASWKSSRQTLIAIAQALLGFGLGFIPCILHGLWIGWDVFWYNLYTLRTLVYIPEVISFAAQVERIEASTIATISSWIVPGVLFVLAQKHLPGRKRWFCIAWLVAAIFGMQIGFWWNWHFFQQIISPFCFASGAGLLALQRTSWRRLWAAVLVAAVSLFAVRDGRLWFLSPYEISWAIWHRAEYLGSAQAADYIARTTSPDDTIYIAFGQAEIYHLSGRHPTIPTQLFYSHARFFDSEWSKVLDAIETRTPAVILWAQPPPVNRISGRDFEQRVLEGYDYEGRFANLRLYRRKEAAPPIPTLKSDTDATGGSSQ